jgi:hypothetical protein
MSDAAFAMVFATFLRWVGILVALVILLPYVDGWMMGLIAKL